jgi:hypothetical protein
MTQSVEVFRPIAVGASFTINRDGVTIVGVVTDCYELPGVYWIIDVEIPDKEWWKWDVVARRNGGST